MFTRKLVVILVPLLLTAALCWVFPLLGNLGFFSNVLRGFLLGGVLALLLPLSGAGKRKEPFGELLWIPAVILLGILVYQFEAVTFGWQLPVLQMTTTTNGQVILVECAFIGYMTVTSIRTKK